MIVALFVLALAMLVGGIASIVQGVPFIRLEMGWTMVIAGSVVMSSGAILGGIAAAVWRLRRIEIELVETREAAERMPALPVPPLPSPVPPSLPPLVAEAPSVSVRPERGMSSMPERLAPDERAVLAAGDLMPPLVAQRDVPETGAPHPSAPEPVIAQARAPVAEEVPPPNPPAEPEAAPEPPPRVVAGTYASGGNNYVMYSDGSIEAETPGGRYTFASLEELKAFAKDSIPAPGA